MEPSSKQRLEVPSCAGALASLLTRRGSSSPSAPSRRAGGGGRLPAPFTAPRAAAPRPISRPSPCRLSEPWRRWRGISTASVASVEMGGGALLSFGFEKKEGAAEIFENGVATGEVGKLPLFPLLIKREGADVSPFRIKKPPTISPTMPHSTCVVRRGCGGYGVRYGVTQAARARALLWAWSNSARHCVWPRPGGSSRCTRVGVP